MELVSFPGNPAPPGGVASTVVTADGIRLRAAVWRPPGARRGTVCLLQGRAEAIEKYYEVIGELLGRGFAVATLDWRGQGGSERRLPDPAKGHVDDFAEYDRDLEAFMRQAALPDCPPPFYALAHSTGGLVALRAATRTRLVFDRLVTTGPLLGLGAVYPSTALVRRLATLGVLFGLGDRGLGALRPGRRAAPGFEGNPLTGDRARYDRTLALMQAAPQLFVGAPTVGWLQAATAAMRAAERPDFAAALKVPVLVVAAGEDRIVSNRAIERFGRTLRIGRAVILPGAQHEILMERDRIRALFWAAFDAFVPGEAGAGQPARASSAAS
ncbi:alpha/beta fold hydrolase [Prosthecomicrobium pneumaticum]|uniref:Lysophospholipase n=1 Tax=Prosthecomicrobium pneumaticum TaxID=81895 RepID=A0A7W9FK96_9HYPH|nr:alpha/beta hydrolase [Prosthecomicrobium pneumaticum]MBB5752547.1 lysophospholipase [Prosthecomicrobium pneumaticum]